MSVRPTDMEERARLLAMSVAATSIADTAGFLTDLHKRIDESILRAVWVLPQIRKLSQSDDAFLAPQPPREDFAVAWPETLDVSAHASAQLCPAGAATSREPGGGTHRSAASRCGQRRRSASSSVPPLGGHSAMVPLCVPRGDSAQMPSGLAIA